MVGLTWTSGYSIVIYAATAIVTIGGALALVTGTGQKVRAWFRPAHPLISHTFESCFVQILGPGEKVEVAGMEVPWEMHGGMTDANRAEGFTYWAHFRDARNRRWEASYNARSRKLDYRRL